MWFILSTELLLDRRYLAAFPLTFFKAKKSKKHQYSFSLPRIQTHLLYKSNEDLL